MYPGRSIFRKHEDEEARTDVAIRRSFAEDLYLVLPGDIDFGTQTISHADLSHAKDVQIVTIDSRTYQKAWVDGALVIVPQASSSSATTPDGSKKLQLAPEVKNQTKPSTPVKPINRKKN